MLVLQYLEIDQQSQCVLALLKNVLHLFCVDRPCYSVISLLRPSEADFWHFVRP